MLNRNDDRNEEKRMVLFCLAAASMVLLLFLVSLYMHDSKKTAAKKALVKQEEAAKAAEDKEKAEEFEDLEVGKSNIVSSDLDFWDMYDDGYKQPIEDIPDDYYDDDDNDGNNDGNKINSNDRGSKKPSNSSSSESEDEIIKRRADEIASERKSSSSSSSSKYSDDEYMGRSSSSRTKDKENMDDGEHIKVVGIDGKAAWYEILEDVRKNKYDFENYLVYDNGMLKYSSPDLKSLTGIDISNNQGTIDFNRVKRAGIDFVMIKVASRGYESGQILIDDKFVEYANGAYQAGLPIGAYITSQAVTDVEAVEEANYAIAAANNYNVRYPIAIDLSVVPNDTARTDKLTSSERTKIVKKFCETVKAYGKTPAICASRDYLIANLNLEDLNGIDIWLKDEAVTADYMRIEYLGNDDDDENNDNNGNNDGNNNGNNNYDSSSNRSSSSSSSRSSSSSSSSSRRSSSSSSNSANREERPDYIGTDYPYNFVLWQCTKKGTVNGIDGPVSINLSFVNYDER